MDYDPRQQYGHLSGRAEGPPAPAHQPPPPQRPQQQLTFGQVFWAVILALLVFSVANYFMMQALLEQQSSGF